jgi:hypothetical protein
MYGVGNMRKYTAVLNQDEANILAESDENHEKPLTLVY